MATKLVSANMGIVLIVERDGKQEKKEFSTTFPDRLYSNEQMYHIVQNICDFINDEFGTEYVCYDSATEPLEIKIAKPKKIKAKRPISQDEFNRKIKELVP